MKQRITDFIKSQGLTVSRFEKMCGLSNGYLRQLRKAPSYDKIEAILSTFPDLNERWLLTGEGEMLKVAGNATTPEPVRKDVRRVPLYSLDVVAGIGNNAETAQYIEELIPWEGALEGDFAVHVTGDSMQPYIPAGAQVLLRETRYGGMYDIQFGKVHAVCFDDRTLLKRVLPDPDCRTNIRLVSYNPDYPDIVIPADSITRLYIAKSVRYDI